MPNKQSNAAVQQTQQPFAFTNMPDHQAMPAGAPMFAPTGVMRQIQAPQKFANMAGASNPVNMIGSIQ